MKLLPPLVVLGLGALLSGQSLSAADLTLSWEKQKPDGSFKGSASDVVVNPPQDEGSAGRQMPNGKVKQIELFTTGSTVMRGASVYRAELPRRVRKAPIFINFMVKGTVGSEPKNGSMVNVDGAIIAFRPIISKNNKALPVVAEMVAKVMGADGKPQWVPLGVQVGLDSQGMTISPRIGVHLDYQNNQWDFYLQDIKLKSSLPLFSHSAHASITMRAGLVDSDTVALLEPKVSEKPHERDSRFLPVDANGQISLAQAVANHDPRLIAPGPLH